MTKYGRRIMLLDKIDSPLYEADSESKDDERLQLILSSINELLCEICKTISQLD